MKTFLAALATAFLSTAAAAQPNIIVIMVDDVSDNLSIMPRVERLLSKGTRYTNSFVNFPLCGPSRATFLTGQEADKHGVMGNSEGFLTDLTGLVPDALRRAGYRTGIFGKSPNLFAGSPGDLGFDHWVTLKNIHSTRFFDPAMDVDGSIRRFTGYTTDVLYSQAERWIDAREGPYFAWIAAVGGHAPNIPAPRHEGACESVPFEWGLAFNELDMSDKPAFMQSLPLLPEGKQRRMEKVMRDQCDTLQADDEWIERFVVQYAGDDTCVFLTADNGFLHGEHRATGKVLLYEESIRVPLVWWGCGAEAGLRDQRLVSNADLPATILELAGADPGRPLDGRSLEGSSRKRVNLHGIWSDEKRGRSGVSIGVRSARWAQFEHSNGERELYDMEADPAQLTSTAGQ
jgi:N-acetylglucosamine-6-sulfatase